jgi:hypothetical protein
MCCNDSSLKIIIYIFSVVCAQVMPGLGIQEEKLQQQQTKRGENKKRKRKW